MEAIKNTKAIIYARVSSKEQEETGYSLDAQENLLKEYAMKNDLSIAKTFRVSESASGKLVRKTFIEMLEYASKNKIANILCEKIDRMTRNLKDASIADEWIKENPMRAIHFVKENFVLNANTKAHENLVWDMKVAIARFYTNNLSEETRKGQKEKVAQGWLPKKPPLGYKTIGEQGHKIHVLDEVMAPFVRKMFELCATGNYSLKALTKIMVDNGLRGQRGKKIQRSVVNRMLSDPFYIGKVRWNKEVHRGEQKTIIDKELFDEVQKVLGRKNKNPVYKKHFPVFKAKIKCELCGGTLTWERQNGHWYARHSNYLEYDNCPKRVYIRQEKIEEQLFPYFDKVVPKSKNALLWLEKAIKESHAEEKDSYQTERTNLNTQFERIQQRLEIIYEDKIDRKVSEEFFAKKFKEYTEEKESIIDRLSKLNNANTKYFEAGYSIHLLASKAQEIYSSEKATIDDKRLLLSYIFSNIPANADKISPNYTLAFEFLVEWMPRVNEIFEPKKGIPFNELSFSESETAFLGAYRDSNPR